MRYAAIALLLPTLLSCGCAATGSAHREAHEAKIPFADLPAPVRKTIERNLAGGHLEDVERCDEHRHLVYEADVRRTDGAYELQILPDGTLISLRRDREDDDHDRHAAPDGALFLPMPLRDGARFSHTITNPFLPLSSVGYAEYVGHDERVVREVEKQTRIVGGVECLVLVEREYEHGQLAEISHNFYAQDEWGNVYYFGEDVDEYRDGQIIGHSGAWLVGRDADEPCLFMPADLRVGIIFKRENAPPHAEEWDRIHALDAELTVPAGRFCGVLVVTESDRADDLPDRWEEQKFYAPGVGLVSENGTLNLTSHRP